jgi:hypothetical protein
MFSSGGRMYTTHAEEKAARLKMERNRSFKATHIYEPIGWDQFDPRGVQGSPIASGSAVQHLPEATKGLHTGMPPEAKRMFNVVRDEHGNIQHVHSSSLRLFRDRRGKS